MGRKITGTIRIGTSNVVVPGNKASFPEEFRNNTRLNYYASLFNTVELNSTFRQVPRSATLAKWCTEVPADFQFTLKLVKDITHVKKLTGYNGFLEPFINAAQSLENKKGCLLVQFPASIHAEYGEEVKGILQTLHEVDTNNQWKKAIEFRNATWYTSHTFRMLYQYKAAMVLQDMPRSNNLHLQQEFPFYYFRYHGPGGDYRGSYTNEFLQEQAAKMKALLARGTDVYVYFNNTMGNAFENARYLQMQFKKM
jgi:uncharacterized protein YecE (DUF72 family)